jgi:hypothetical protein
LQWRCETYNLATRWLLSNVIRSKQKGPFTSTDGKCRKFTGDAEVDLTFLVKKHKEDIAKGKTFVDSRHDAILACVFYSLPTKVLSGGFTEGRMYERGLTLWIREQSECCQDLNYNNGGGPGALPRTWRSAGGRRGSPVARRERRRPEPRSEASGPRFGPHGCAHPLSGRLRFEA